MIENFINFSLYGGWKGKFETWLLHLIFVTSNNPRFLTGDLRKLSEKIFAITTFQIYLPHIYFELSMLESNVTRHVSIAFFSLQYDDI